MRGGFSVEDHESWRGENKEANWRAEKSSGSHGEKGLD